MGKFEKRLLDFVGQRLKSRAVVEMSPLLFDLLPELLNGVRVWRIRRQLADLKLCRLLGKESFGLRACVIFRPILNQDNRLSSVLQYPREKGNVGGGIEAAVLPVIKEPPRAVLNHPEDFIAFAFA